MGSTSELQIFPDSLLSEARTLSRVSFTDAYGASRVLLVVVESHDSALALGLQESAEGKHDPLEVRQDALGFETSSGIGVLHSAPKSSVPPQGFNSSKLKLRTAILRQSFYVAPLRRRSIPGRPNFQRITVGRARNNDIVLRDGSVSKFHAWFETSSDERLLLGDAKTTNGTFVNGTRVQGGMLAVTQADVLRFGGVEAIVSSAETLWDAIRGV